MNNEEQLEHKIHEPSTSSMNNPDCEIIEQKSKYNIQEFSMSKMNESSERENEDSVDFIDDDEQIISAISDGAGGVGLLSSKWSKCIVENFIKKQPTKASIDDWLGEFSHSFSSDKQFNDVFKKTKFRKEGSFASLCGAVINKNSNKIYSISYGDSMLLHFDKDWSLKYRNPNIYLSDFSKFPHLLNWKDIAKSNLTTEENSDFDVEDKLILASDGLAFMLLSIYLLQDTTKKYDQEINLMLEKPDLNHYYFEKLKNSDYKISDVVKDLCSDFETNIKIFYDNNCLTNDDYSFVFIERLS